MTIQEKINADLKTAMLAKDEAKKSLLRVLIGEFNREGKEVNDTVAMAKIKKMVDNAKEILGGPTMLDQATAQNCQYEIATLSSYLPQQLTADELRVEITRIVIDKGFTSIKDQGKIMGELKAQFAGKYDGKIASDLIKTKFAE